MFSQKCFCSWERNCAEDGNFLCDIGWRRTNQSTALLSVQQGKDDYQTAKQTKLYHATAGSSLTKTPPLFLLLVKGCERDEMFNRDVSVELLQGSLAIFVSCLVTWLSEGSWCPFGVRGWGAGAVRAGLRSSPGAARLRRSALLCLCT